MSVPSETNPLHYKITCNFEDCLCFFSSRCSLLPVLWICKYELTVSVSTHLCFVVFLPPSFVMLITCAWVSKPEQWKQVCFPVWGSTLFIQPSKKSVWWGQSIISQKPLGSSKNVKPLNQKPLHKDENTSPLYPEAKCEEKSVNSWKESIKVGKKVWQVGFHSAQKKGLGRWAEICDSGQSWPFSPVFALTARGKSGLQM